MKNSNLTIITNNLNSKYYNIIKFLEINQRTINQIKTNYSSIKKQIYQSLLYLKKLKPTLTKQTIYNTLFYTNHSNIIKNLNSK